MSDFEAAMFVSFIAVFLPTFVLYHYLIFKVNQHLTPDRKIRHSMSLDGWRRLGLTYKELYPGDVLYSLTNAGAVLLLIVAVANVVFRFWEYFAREL